MGNDDKSVRRALGFGRVREHFGVMRSLARVGLCGSALAFALSTVARAEETQAQLLSEPFDFTEVADAFDENDPFDLNVRLSFERSSSFETIQRENVASGAEPGGSVYVPVAESEITQNTLELGFDAGIYRDLMVFARMPLVLAETRRLTLPDAARRCGSTPCPPVDALLHDISEGSGPPAHEYLLTLDPSFESTTRSGVPYFDVGVAWGIVNQYRTRALPTWVVSMEGRVPLGAVMKPCAPGMTCDAGISRGTARVKLETRFSYRVRYLEPYFGMSHAIEWATTAQPRFSPGGDLPGYVDAQPPSVSEVTLGSVIVPWEERGHFQRFGIDVRSTVAYVSSGRDYTSLFDALGTSDSAFLTANSTESLGASANASKSIPFTGLTQVAQYAKLGLETAFVIQAAQYVRFRLGGGVVYSTPHLLTNTSPCNEDSHARAGDSRIGTCGDSYWNPLYRPVIDLPGQRFRSGGEYTWSFFANAIGQF